MAPEAVPGPGVSGEGEASSRQGSGGASRPRRLLAPLRIAFKALVILATVVVLAGAALLGGGYWLARRGEVAEPPVPDDAATLQEQNASLRKKIERLHPKGQFILVDTGRNRLYLKDGGKVLREAVVSCGSGGVLQDPSGKKTWVFDTPRGERVVKSKVKNPTWIKPDWAFIEEGEAIPKKYDDRAEEGVMGDYALGIGDGYFIHGTLYSRLLGRNVSHGCIRVGDEDLEYLFKATPLGTKVYIF